MTLQINNPLPLLSLNVLGLGVDVILGQGEDKYLLTIEINFAVGKYTKHVEFRRNG